MSEKLELEWHLENRNLRGLIEYEKNARILGEKTHMLLSGSITKFGMAEKPIINLDDIIIGGHQRVSILLEKGYEECECWVPNRLLNEKEAEEFNILLNKLSGDWDYDILANLHEIPDLLTWGFDEDDLGLGKPEKAAKQVKPVISFEFADKEIMMTYIQQFEDIATESAAKMKVRG